MTLMAKGKCESLLRGYRLIRKEKTPGQPVTCIGPYYGELGFECFGYQDKVRHAISKLHSRGEHVVVIGLTNRHPMYESADEYWGCVGYQDGNPDVKQEIISRFDDGAKTMNIEPGTEPTYPDSLVIMRGSAKAKAKAAEIASVPTIMILPRYRPEEGARNYRFWPLLVERIKGDVPEAQIISCCTSNRVVDMPGVKSLEKMVGSWNLMDVESEMHRLAMCSIACDSGCQCVPILAGARSLILFCGMYPSHDRLYVRMNEKFPGYCELRVADTSAILGADASPGIAAADMAIRCCREMGH